jgi:hypothetical protein
MKRILLTLTLAFVCIQYNQAQTTSVKISYVSPQKDTLILPDDDLGKLIASTWVDRPVGKTPVIILTDEDTIKRKNEWLNYYVDTRKKGKSSKK